VTKIKKKSVNPNAPIDYVLEWMKANKIPLTRKNYLAIEYMGQEPEEGGEIEAAMTKNLRRRSG